MNTPRQVAPGEMPALVLSGLAFFFILTAYYIVRPVRDQLSGAVGSTSLPLFYAITLAAMLLLTPLFGWLVSRFPRRRLLGWSYGFFILCLIGFIPAFVAQDRIGARELGTVFFVWVSVFNLFVVSLFWSFMADVFDSGQARRLFPVIALGGMGGALFGPAVTSLLVKVLGVAPLLVVSAITLSLALLLLLKLSTREDIRHEAEGGGEAAIGGSLWAGIRDAWSQPFLRYMAILMLLSDGVGTLAYTLVADYAKANYHDNAARTAFYAHLDLAINLLGALMQVTVTRWLLVRFGAGWGLVVPSLINLALLLVVAAFGAIDIRILGFVVPLLAIMQVVTRGTAYGMTKPASDALYTRVAREARYKGKNFIETAVWRFGDLIVTSGVNLLHGVGVGLAGLAMICAGFSGIAAYIGRRAGTAPDLLPERRDPADA
ncbi:MAG TPA: translocase [Luteibacter sp.]|jgi:AAA family ATP:ADP antiporter|nr:translocase [Luteibacter sp.]